MQAMFAVNFVASHSEVADRVALPENEQVARGQELLQMLREQPFPSASSDSAGANACSETDVKVIVKHTFIEVVDPKCNRRMNRSMSDSELIHCASDSERTWQPQTKSSDKFQDMLDSDASTTISNDADDSQPEDNGYLGGRAIRKDTCWSDDEGPAMDMYMPFMPYPYVESWWMPMNFDGNGTMYTAMPDGSFVSQQWADQSNIECEGGDSDSADQEWRTTVMLRNMPNNYTRDMLIDLVDTMGFAGCYDFAYLPVDFKSQAGLGYAFINFVSSEEAQRCFDQFEGFSEWRVPSEKVCTVTWGSPYQGLEAHVERYQNSPVMHHSIPDEWKPVLFDRQGVRLPFPPPTKAIKTPKVRQQPSA